MEGSKTTKESRQPVFLSKFRKLSATLHRMLKLGSFERCRPTADSLRDLIRVNRASLQKNVEEEYYKAMCLLSEAYDYLGAHDDARQASLEGQAFEDLSIPSDLTSPSSRSLIREKIRLCLDFALIHLYRSQNYSAAKKRVSACLDFVNEKLRTDEDSSDPFPCYGTLAQATIYLGRIQSQMNEFDEAEERFRQAMDYMQKRFLWRTRESGRTRAHTQEELSFTVYRSAICLGLGLGWVYHKRGLLRKALDCVNWSRLLFLTHPPDPLNRASLDLILGSINRSLAGSNKQELDKAISLMNRSLSILKRLDHKPYTAWAAYELSLAYLQQKDLYHAEKMIDRVEQLSRKEDVRSHCNCLIVRSRLHTNLRARVDFANRAVLVASQHQQELGLLEALMNRGEVLSNDPDRRRDALTDLRTALAVLTKHKSVPISNPRIGAFCYLHMARISAQMSEGLNAIREYRLGKQLASRVDEASIGELVKSVEDEIAPLMQDFWVSARGVNRGYWEHEWRLRKWLLNRAKVVAESDSSQKSIATILNVAPQTPRNWEKGLKRRVSKTDEKHQSG